MCTNYEGMSVLHKCLANICLFLCWAETGEKVKRKYDNDQDSRLRWYGLLLSAYWTNRLLTCDFFTTQIFAFMVGLLCKSAVSLVCWLTSLPVSYIFCHVSFTYTHTYAIFASSSFIHLSYNNRLHNKKLSVYFHYI